MSDQEYVVLVDEQDCEQGIEEKLSAHQQGLLHRAFSVFVMRVKDGQLETLLQQRQFDKYHCGGLWSNTCCSHPRQSEAVLAAGMRRLQEELGFSVPLKTVGSFIYRAEFSNGLTEHELDHVLVGSYDQEEVVFNTSEVAATRWVALSDLAQNLQQEPEQYTPWLALALKLVTNNQIQITQFLNQQVIEAAC